MIMTIGNFAFSSVFKKKCDRLYTILQKMVGYTQRPRVRQNFFFANSGTYKNNSQQR